MDLFKFNPSNQTYLEQGQPINGYSSVMWTERYADCGEVSIEAPLSTGLRDILPTGCFISHVETSEVMIIENHEINETNDSDPVLKITGRSFESYLENRLIGLNQARQSSTRADYNMALDATWNQVITLINSHIQNTQDPNDGLANVRAASGMTGVIGAGTREARIIEPGTVLDRVQELLPIDDIGIKTIRRSNFGFPGGSNTDTILSVYNGQDLSSKITFSWNAGDITSGDYLFSDRKFKNSALVTGRYIQTIVDATPAVTNYNRRFMKVNAQDMDESYNSPPSGPTLVNLLNAMAVRGRKALKNQSKIALSRADISNVIDYRYRRDFNVGDLVTLDANYGQTMVTRIIEYVEIDDENGASGHPTLQIPGG